MILKVDYPIYELKLPSNGKEIKVRPFLVKEEKLLLMVVKSNDAKEIIKTTKQVINNCILEPEINLDTLPFFDIDYLFIALRAKSIGEKINVNYICQNIVDDNVCGGKFSVEIDISNVEINVNEDISKDIKLKDDLIFKMKYPSYSVIKMLDEKEEVLNQKIKLIVASIDRIFMNGEYHSNKDFASEELENFIENLTSGQFEKLEEFVSNYPSFYATGKGKCNKCEKEHIVRYDDFMSFFQ